MKPSSRLSRREQRILQELEAQFTDPAAGRALATHASRSPSTRRRAVGALLAATTLQAVVSLVLLIVFFRSDATWSLYAFAGVWTSTLATSGVLWRLRRAEAEDPRPGRRRPSRLHGE